MLKHFNIKGRDKLFVNSRVKYRTIVLSLLLLVFSLSSSCTFHTPAPAPTRKEGCTLRMGDFHEDQEHPDLLRLAQPPDVAPNALEFDLPASRSGGSGEDSFIQKGLASWYDSEMRNLTASGERFCPTEYAAAHKTLPMGTVVEITNLENGRSCKVRINDRGPFIKGRVIDVTPRAATVLDMVEQGLAQVKVRVLKYPKQKDRK